VGRNYAYQTPSSVTLFFEDRVFNHSWRPADGHDHREFKGDNFDHSGLASSAAASSRRRPAASRPDRGGPVPRRQRALGRGNGSARWATYFNRSFPITIQGACQSYPRQLPRSGSPTFADAMASRCGAGLR